MKKLNKIKLNQLNKDELEKRQMNSIYGGCSSHCGCGCAAGSGTYDNGNANYAGGLHTPPFPDGCVICSGRDMYWYAAD